MYEPQQLSIETYKISDEHHYTVIDGSHENINDQMHIARPNFGENDAYGGIQIINSFESLWQKSDSYTTIDVVSIDKVLTLPKNLDYVIGRTSKISKFSSITSCIVLDNYNGYTWGKINSFSNLVGFIPSNKEINNLIPKKTKLSDSNFAHKKFDPKVKKRYTENSLLFPERFYNNKPRTNSGENKDTTILSDKYEKPSATKGTENDLGELNVSDAPDINSVKEVFQSEAPLQEDRYESDEEYDEYSKKIYYGKNKDKVKAPNSAEVRYRFNEGDITNTYESKSRPYINYHPNELKSERNIDNYNPNEIHNSKIKRRLPEKKNYKFDRVSTSKNEKNLESNFKKKPSNICGYFKGFEANEFMLNKFTNLNTNEVLNSLTEYENSEFKPLLESNSITIKKTSIDDFIHTKSGAIFIGKISKTHSSNLDSNSDTNINASSKDTLRERKSNNGFQPPSDTFVRFEPETDNYGTYKADPFSMDQDDTQNFRSFQGTGSGDSKDMLDSNRLDSSSEIPTVRVLDNDGLRTISPSNLGEQIKLEDIETQQTIIYGSETDMNVSSNSGSRRTRETDSSSSGSRGASVSDSSDELTSIDLISEPIFEPISGGDESGSNQASRILNETPALSFPADESGQIPSTGDDRDNMIVIESPESTRDQAERVGVSTDSFDGGNMGRMESAGGSISFEGSQPSMSDESRVDNSATSRSETGQITGLNSVSSEEAGFGEVMMGESSRSIQTSGGQGGGFSNDGFQSETQQVKLQDGAEYSIVDNPSTNSLVDNVFNIVVSYDPIKGKAGYNVKKIITPKLLNSTQTDVKLYGPRVVQDYSKEYQLDKNIIFEPKPATE
ncbi:hypothetical protein AYI69_g96 [Smittium culicis]|uniref:Uncharacterized protein n=1 Tax=Smittium culicis TaxID=133412 RepID=A0A1R1YU20_9FUNG|nr:hypothetical protein AYI69_g96 [Smittium culicis]